MLRDVPSFVAQFYVYESLKRAFLRDGETTDQLSTGHLLLAGGLGGVAGIVLEGFCLE